MDTNQENVIEWLKGQNTVSLTLTNRQRLYNKITKLIESGKYADEITHIVNNADGTLVCHIPLNWIKINPTRDISEEYRKELAERMRAKFN